MIFRIFVIAVCLRGHTSGYSCVDVANELGWCLPQACYNDMPVVRIIICRNM